MKLSTSNILGVIPARFNSTRLSGKPLKLIGDKTMIEHVYLRANKVLENYNFILARNKYLRVPYDHLISFKKLESEYLETFLK